MRILFICFTTLFGLKWLSLYRIQKENSLGLLTELYELNRLT